jgi:hypothetical protein
MEVNGDPHAPAALPRGRESHWLGHTAGHDFWENRKSLEAAGIFSPDRTVSSLVTTLPELSQSFTRQ